jgi:uncharacterized membrane protein
MTKKILKIIGGFFLLLLCIFLAMGLIYPQVNYTATVVVNRPIDETFNLFNDVSKIQSWIPEIKKLEIINSTPQKIGTKIKMLIESEGEKMEMDETITHFKENELVTLHFIAGDMIKTDSITFKSINSTTQITGNYTCQGSSYLYKCLFSFFTSYFKKTDEGYLSNFKEFAEKQ